MAIRSVSDVFYTALARLPFLLLLATGASLGWGGSRTIRRQYGPRLDTPGRTLVILTALITFPTIVMVVWPSGNRWRRVKPALASVVSETRRRLHWGRRPDDFTALASSYQQAWLRRRPARRRPTAPAAPRPAPGPVAPQPSRRDPRPCRVAPGR